MISLHFDTLSDAVLCQESWLRTRHQRQLRISLPFSSLKTSVLCSAFFAAATCVPRPHQIRLQVDPLAPFHPLLVSPLLRMNLLTARHNLPIHLRVYTQHLSHPWLHPHTRTPAPRSNSMIAAASFSLNASSSPPAS